VSTKEEMKKVLCAALMHLMVRPEHRLEQAEENLKEMIREVIAPDPPKTPDPRTLVCPRCHTFFEDPDPTKEYPNGIICPVCPKGGLVGVIHPGQDLR